MSDRGEAFIPMAGHPPKGPRTFYLLRLEDETGVSGTGIVCEGCLFSDGTVTMQWIVGEYRSTVVWPPAMGIAAVDAIHGHGGKTQIVWHDDV